MEKSDIEKLINSYNESIIDNKELIMDYNSALKKHITDIKIFLDFIDNKRSNAKLIEYFKDRKRKLECRFKNDNVEDKGFPTAAKALMDSVKEIKNIYDVDRIFNK